MHQTTALLAAASINTNNSSFYLILGLGIATYISMAWQMLDGKYAPSFFSRGVWFLLGVNSFMSIILGEHSASTLLLASTLLVGNAIVFVISYFKGSRAFMNVEKFSLALLIIAGVLWAILNMPFIGLILGLAAHFIGGLPTFYKAIKKPASEQAYHWYLFFTASFITILSTPDHSIEIILFPLYFVMFDGAIILLVNRRKMFHPKSAKLKKA